MALTQIFDIGVQAGGELVPELGAHDSFAGAGKRRDPRGEVHIGAVDVVLVDHEVRQVAAHAQFDRGAGLLTHFAHQLMHFHCRTDALTAVGKFKHQPIAQAFDQPAAIGRQQPLDGLLHEAVPTMNKSCFVLLHEPHRFDDVHHHQHLGVPR